MGKSQLHSYPAPALSIYPGLPKPLLDPQKGACRRCMQHYRAVLQITTVPGSTYPDDSTPKQTVTAPCCRPPAPTPQPRQCMAAGSPLPCLQPGGAAQDGHAQDSPHMDKSRAHAQIRAPPPRTHLHQQPCLPLLLPLLPPTQPANEMQPRAKRRAPAQAQRDRQREQHPERVASRLRQGMPRACGWRRTRRCSPGPTPPAAAPRRVLLCWIKLLGGRLQ